MWKFLLTEGTGQVSESKKKSNEKRVLPLGSLQSDYDKATREKSEGSK